jgi:hypothetical protein
MENIIVIIGNVVLGLAIAGCVISCLQVWNLTKTVEKLSKDIKKLKKS